MAPAGQEKREKVKLDRNFVTLKVWALIYPVSAETAYGRTAVVESLVHLDRVVAALVLVLQLESEEGQMHVLARRSFNDPIAVLLVVVVVIAVLGMGVEMFDAGRRLQMTAANFAERKNMVEDKVAGRFGFSFTGTRTFTGGVRRLKASPLH